MLFLGVTDGVVEGEEWWYPTCKCHVSVTSDSGSYYCKGCVKHVFHMVPRLCGLQSLWLCFWKDNYVYKVSSCK